MSHILMNALTSSPTGGGSLGEDVDPNISRAISFEWWTAACPQSQVVELQMTATVKELTDSSTGEERLIRWAEKLRNIEAGCVQVVGGSSFDYMHISIQFSLAAYLNIVIEYAWSSLITRALSRNFFALFSSASPPLALAPFLSRITTTPGAGSADHPYPLTAFAPYRASAPPIPGLLALHVRRGDYAQHCNNLASWGSDFNAWNLFGRPDIRAVGRYPALPDHLPAGPRPRRSSRAVSESGADFPAQALKTVVASSHDMRLARDEFAVSQAVDMGVLVAAETFIGVGFSSLSSNVVQLRLAGGRDPGTSRFW
ncbi:hypothetical protein DFH09DRAFT_1395004 [Mycena vulgaris]|nr:hypothetical protein DFH09DRAFT_1395004 [Mycena vulgaris]